MTAPRFRKRLLVPEVVQVSLMDCGPATLKCLLEGYGIRANYGRLREACQTDVDGSSIDTLEEIAQSVGIPARQVMIPADHLLLPGQGLLPAIVTIRTPARETHFVILWSVHGPFVQVMDPARGRRWIRRASFVRDLYIGEVRVPAADWRVWAGSAEFLDALRLRLRRLGLRHRRIDAHVSAATSDASWRSLAALDAVTRLTASLVESGSLPRGRGAARVMEHCLRQTRTPSARAQGAIPAAYWSVEAAPRGDEDELHLLMRGAVLIRTGGARVDGDARAEAQRSTLSEKEISPHLRAALAEPEIAPERTLGRMLLEDGWCAPTALALAAAVAAGGVLLEALLFRTILDMGRDLAVPVQRAAGLAVLFVFLLGLLALEWPLVGTTMRIGRHVETRMRAAFHAKIPRLVDAYFRSRAVSDMAERCHGVNNVRALPNLASQVLRLVFSIAFTTAGIVWIDRALLVPAVLCGTVPIALAILAQPFLAERDLRARNHAGAMTRFAIDSLLGLIPIRSHRAERSVRREHEALLVEWARSSASFLRSTAMLAGLQILTGFALVAWIVALHLRSGESSAVLLLVFWAMSLPTLGRTLAQLSFQYPTLRNAAARVLEPLGAPEHEAGEEDAVAFTRARETAGVDLRMRELVVRAGGQTILDRIDLRVEPGEHVAIVGPSGAGKSSLVGVLLGWHGVSSGTLEVDGAALDLARVEALRRETAWVDPAVQLWNDSLFENLRYGAVAARASLTHALDVAELQAMLHRLPDGLSTSLGEGGGFLSGGEGQRVRLGRAVERRDARLVILDEPFRALDREQRRRLLEKTRAYWKGATLFYITHDIEQALDFERVLVIEERRIAEDGVPRELAARVDSRYAALLRSEGAVREELWGAPDWKRLWLEEGGFRRGTTEARKERAQA